MTTSHEASTTTRSEAERLWALGQDVADRLDRQAEQEAEADERERLGDLADALRGL